MVGKIGFIKIRVFLFLMVGFKLVGNFRGDIILGRIYIIIFCLEFLL